MKKSHLYIVMSIALFLLSGCQKKLPLNYQSLQFNDKYLVINTKSQDNRQNLTEEQMRKALFTALQKPRKTLLHDKIHISRVFHNKDYLFKINYEYDSDIIASYEFEVEVQPYLNSFALKFYNFKEAILFDEEEPTLKELIKQDFKNIYSELNHLYFTQEKVLILTHTFLTTLDNKQIEEQLSKHFKPYKKDLFDNLYLVPYGNQLIPIYIEILKSKYIYMRSYIPYTMNTRSGSNISSYKLHLFKQKIEKTFSK